MQLKKYLKEGRKLSDARTAICVEVGKSGEALFRELTGAHKSSLEDDKKHIDFYWDDRKVDVKGLKKMHHSGFILLEFINVWGGHGWCSRKSKAEYIAFQFPEAFYVFRKNHLRTRALDLCEVFDRSKVIRKNWIPYDEGKYKWIGRYNAQDVFTYLKFEDVKDLIFEVLPYAYTREENK